MAQERPDYRQSETDSGPDTRERMAKVMEPNVIQYGTTKTINGGLVFDAIEHRRG